jgi:O-methyltransferase
MGNFTSGRTTNSGLIDDRQSLGINENTHRPKIQSYGNILKELFKKFLRWFASSKTVSRPWKLVSTPIIWAIESQGCVFVSYADPERRHIIDLIREIKRQTPMLLFDNEAYQIFTAVKSTERIEGDLAEVGVYSGGSARLIRAANRSKALHLFDTFEGLPEVEAIDSPQFNKGQFAASFEDVKNCLKEYNNVHFYKGLFPTTATPVEDKKFSFVHFDVDTYESTRSCLDFFYSRMNKGGIILSHDYISAPGVRRAFDECFSNKAEPIIEMSGTQCLIVKL